MLDQPDEFRRGAGRDRGGARIHRGDGGFIRDWVRAHAPFDRRPSGRRRKKIDRAANTIHAINLGIGTTIGIAGAGVNHPVTIAVVTCRSHNWLPARSLQVPTLEKVSLDIAVVLGTSSMPIHQALRLGRGAIIELDATEADDVWILANNMPVAKGTVVVNGNRIAVQIKSILPRGTDQR